jgi:putative FmdB family regulatory protein
MPTYEYECKSCGHRFEKFQSIKAAPIKTCPKCGKNTAQRLISAGAGIIFKGSGFYITDYRDQAYTDKAKAESGGGSDASKTDSKPAETKTETKAETKPAATEPKPTPAAPAPKTESKPSKSAKKK